MTANNIIVEIDGIWFRFQKLRGRRALRARVRIESVLGATAASLLAQPDFEAADPATRRKAWVALATTARVTGGRISDPDSVIALINELIEHTPEHGGQGVSHRSSDPGTGTGGFAPVRSLDTIDNYDTADDLTILGVAWEIYKLTLRPTTAARGTDAGTAPAAAISPTSSPSGTPPNPETGPPSTQTLSPSGCISLS